MAFIQIVEFTTTRIGEIDEVLDEWVRTTEGRRRTHRATMTNDRDRPNTYVQIVEFASFKDAMANSAMPETAVFADRLAQLCDGVPAFRNLDLHRVFDLA